MTEASRGLSKRAFVLGLREIYREDVKPFCAKLSRQACITASAFALAAVLVQTCYFIGLMILRPHCFPGGRRAYDRLTSFNVLDSQNFGFAFFNILFGCTLLLVVMTTTFWITSNIIDAAKYVCKRGSYTDHLQQNENNAKQ